MSRGKFNPLFDPTDALRNSRSQSDFWAVTTILCQHELPTELVLGSMPLLGCIYHFTVIFRRAR